MIEAKQVLRLLVAAATLAGGAVAITADPVAGQRFPTKPTCIKAQGELPAADYTAGTCINSGKLNPQNGSDSAGSDGGNGNSSDPNNSSDGDGDGGGGPPATPPPPTPAEAQQAVVMSATTYYYEPKIAVDAGANPEIKIESTVNVPTFVQVTNWMGKQVDDPIYDPYGMGYWVQITSTPSLSFDPKEPGAPIIQCEDGGTRYDPNGPSARDQAARPGACAWRYKRRTGVDDRPDRWMSEVIITWTIEWRSNFDLSGYDLPSSARQVEVVPREVGEVSSVVVDD